MSYSVHNVREMIIRAVNNQPIAPEQLEYLQKSKLVTKYLDGSFATTLDGDELLGGYGKAQAVQPEAKFEATSVKDLMEKVFPPVSWLIGDLIQEQTIGLIVAPRSSFKSWIVLYFAVCLSQGLPILNRMATKSSRVLYIDMETDERNIQERLVKIQRGLGLKSLDNIEFKSFAKERLDNKEDLDKIIGYMREKQIGVLIIDTLKRVHNKRENQADSINELFTNYLRKLQQETGSTIILIHHTKKKPVGTTITDKMDMARGSNEIVNYVDWFLMVDRKGRENFVKLSQEKSRFSSEAGITGIKVMFAEDNSKVTFEYVPEADWYVSEAPFTIKLISDWIVESNISGFATKDIKQYLKNIGESDNPKIVTEALRTMEEKGLIRKVKRGSYEVLSEEEKQAKLP